ncbi:MAG: hypothetical protein AMXMBFR4_31170 [Candidatus Hydrogenedentota bacterium]
MSMPQTILIIGAFDTKGPEFAFLRDRILQYGHDVLTMNIGVLGGTDQFPVDIDADSVAAAAGTCLEKLRAEKDRGTAMKVMATGAPRVIAELYAARKFSAVIGMGGTGGSSVICSALRALPIGVPKVCVSTAAAGDVSAFVGAKDIVMVPSIVDIAGINRVSRIIFAEAAAAVCGMAAAGTVSAEGTRPVIAASMFGNTTACVTQCAGLLEAHGYEVLVFHAVGSGGRTMESLVDEGLVDAVLDITTTEWADEICGGVFTAGPDRLGAPGRRGIPHLIVPGCIDMVNFGPLETVPKTYRDAGRSFYEWNPSVTLMRTNEAENRELGRVFAEKANAAQGPVAFLLPLRGVSILDGEGQPFCDWAADRAMYETLKQGLRPDIVVEELDSNINDAAFAKRAVDMLLHMIAAAGSRRLTGGASSQRVLGT